MNNNNSNEKNDNKTYVWIKLHNGRFVHDSGVGRSPTRGGSNVTYKKRGAPSSTINGNGDDDVWNWTPGYYTLVTTDNDNDATTLPPIAKEKDVTSVTDHHPTSQQQYQFTLLNNPNSNSNQEQTTDLNEQQQVQHVLTEEDTNRL